MKDNPLLKISTFGQSVWLDLIRRGMLESGEFQRLIDEDGLRGVTSNPSIFEKAIGESADYDEEIRSLAEEGNDVGAIYQALTVADIQHATDLFRPVYDRTAGGDGLVSLEVSPHLAHDTAGTLSEARKLWAAVGRPNVMIKVPATDEGLPAITQLLTEGLNVNITLLFGLDRYRTVAEAYLAALEARAARGQPLDRVASVASFFLSRIDVLIDPLLESIVKQGGPQADTARALRGQVAIIQAKVAYHIYQELFSAERFRKLADRGARPQRLLWASTSTKNKQYKDVMYVEALIGPNTVNTLPLETLDAYRDHGKPAPRLEEGLDQAQQNLDRLAEVGISLEQAVKQLEKEGVDKFVQPFDKLFRTLEEKRHKKLAGV
jgi:transaldolase